MKPILRIATLLLLLSTVAISSIAQSDDCGPTAPVITVNTSCVVGSTTYSTTSATASTQSSAYLGADDDVWFSFTTLANQTAAKIEISNTVGAGQYPIAIEVWSSCSNMVASNNSGLLAGGLTPLTQYYIRVYTTGTVNRLSSFQICAYTVLGNDECTYATTLPVSSGSNCTSTINGTTVGATNGYVALTGCLSETYYSIKDVWYKFVATSTSAQISLSNIVLASGISSSMSMQLTGTDCNTATSVQCGTAGTLSASNLAIGTTYYLRVYNTDASSACTFSICASVPSVPINNECTGAAVVAVNTDGTFNLSVNGSTVFATQSSQSMIPCTIPADDDVWFKFIAPSTGAVQLSLSNATQTMFTSVYSGTCGALANRKCIYGAGDTLLGLTPNAIYYARVMTQNSNVNSAFNIAIRAIAAPATNTTCGTAANLTTTYQQGTTAGLAVNSSIIACYGSAAPNKELWYSFTATSSSHFIDFSDMVRLSANANNLGFRVNSGACASLTSIKCVDAVAYANSSITGLTVGSTYYVQVLENTYNGGPVQYAVRLRTPQAPSNDEYNGGGVPTLVQEPTASYGSTTMRFATLSANPPSGTYTQDVWYRFYAATSSVSVSITDGLADATTRIALYNSDGTTLNNAGADGRSASFAGLTVGTVYYLRVLNKATATESGASDFKIAVFGTPSSLLADAAPVGSNCVTADGPVTSTNSGRWLHITHQGKMLASVFDNAGNAMGAMTAKYYTNSAAVRSDASGIEYLNRNYEITPAVQPTNPVMVRLYFSKAEFDALVNANDGDGNDVLWISDLKIAKFSSVPCAAALTLAGEQLYNIMNWGSLTSTVYFVDVQVPAFSSFFLKTVAGGLLPVICSNFNYKTAEGKVQLQWSTQTETNAKEFALQRSSDGVNFTTIATIAANGNSSSVKQYQFVDVIRNNETVYYRLQQKDLDDKQQFVCRTLKVSTAGKQLTFGNAYPNPVSSAFTIDVQKAYTGKVDVQIINTLGQVMQQQTFNLQAADTQLKIKLGNHLTTGTYTVRLITNEGVQVQQVTKM